MKKIALITDGWGRYVTYTWIQGYRNYMAAHQSDMDLYIFQSFGNFSMDEKHNQENITLHGFRIFQNLTASFWILPPCPSQT